MTDKDGGAAFYMTLRDRMAVAIVSGIGAQVFPGADLADWSKRVWAMADAMLAARDPKPAEAPTGEVPF